MVVKVAVVGPEESKWLAEQKVKAKEKIHEILAWNILDDGLIDNKGNYVGPLVLVSGHCPKGGVDIWAEEIANNLGIKKEIYKPEINQWKDDFEFSNETYDNHGMDFPKWIRRKNGYKSRNIQIAENCDTLHCIVPHNRVGLNITPYNPKYYCRHCKRRGHPTNGGCWTMKYAKKLGKETHLVIVE